MLPEKRVNIEVKSVRVTLIHFTPTALSTIVEIKCLLLEPESIETAEQLFQSWSINTLYFNSSREKDGSEKRRGEGVKSLSTKGLPHSRFRPNLQGYPCFSSP